MGIRKAVIAVAGFGTRFLPATKAVPKELLPIVDRPIVQYLVQELVDSGIRDIILVTRAGTQAIADHFDTNRELERHLVDNQMPGLLTEVQAVAQMANFAIVRQGQQLPYGNGSPLLAAKQFLDQGEPFVFLFGDDLVLSGTPCVRQLINVYTEYKPAGVIAFQEVSEKEICRYGAARLKAGTAPKEIAEIVEKPQAAAPSNLAQLGRFVLPWRTIEILEELAVQVQQGQADELYLTYAVNQLCRESRVLAHPIEGQWLTTGDPLRYLEACVEYALRDKTIGGDFAKFLSTLDLGQSSVVR
jgi:UTP--glucose-1-phosphate uridylyltransferase